MILRFAMHYTDSFLLAQPASTSYVSFSSYILLHCRKRGEDGDDVDGYLLLFVLFTIVVLMFFRNKTLIINA
jgi:hypothetical protein